MTKVYLVKLKAWNKVSQHYIHVVLEVFTNKKKAEIYAEYLNLKAQIKKPDYLTTYDDITYKVEEYGISTIDWSNDLLELQTKNLPF